MSKFTSLPHLRGNPFAIVDVETTGLVAGYHEIIQIAIVPLNLDLDVAQVRPFYYNIKPNNPEHAESQAGVVHGINIDDLLLNAPTQDKVLDYLLEWFSELPLGHERRLTPIAHNWGFERGFLTSWLGPDLMNSIFHPHPRDTMIYALMLNDRAAMMGKDPPFPRVGLVDMCRRLGIPLERAHDALADCMATAKLYSTLSRAILG